LLVISLYIALICPPITPPLRLSIIQGNPKLTLLAINLPSCPFMLLNDRQGDHVVEVLEAIQG
jgi:hypothetical protein